jgi:hypothetical protein
MGSQGRVLGCQYQPPGAPSIPNRCRSPRQQIELEPLPVRVDTFDEHQEPGGMLVAGFDVLRLGQWPDGLFFVKQEVM